MTELVDQNPQRHAVLKRHRYRGGEGIHEAGDGGAFLRHSDEDLPGLPVFVHARSNVALVPGDIELVGNRPSLIRQLAP